MSTTLKTFFERAHRASLSDCDHEQLHLSGAIQDVGALLAVNLKSRSVTAFSANLPRLIGRAPEEIGASPFDRLKPALDLDFNNLSESVNRNFHVVLDGQMTTEYQQYDLIAHLQGDTAIIDCLPSGNLTAADLKRCLRQVKEAYTRIVSAADYAAALQIALEAARRITGFNRVKVYELAPDWSGVIIAESRAEQMASYLGLHFPATDIPQQARYLYQTLPFRAVFSSEDDIAPVIQVAPDARSDQAAVEQLDLSWSLLRSVSPIHTQYLRNMAVKASFAVGIEWHGRLQNILICHHDSPAILPYDVWGMIRDIGDALMLKYHHEQEAERTRGLIQVRAVEANIASAVRDEPDLTVALQRSANAMSSVLESSGFAIISSDAIFSTGKVPPDGFIRDLIAWTTSRTDQQDSYATSSLHKDWPPARKFMDVACGVLLQPVKASSNHYYLWFREPITKQTRWAGDPYTSKTIGLNGKPTLAPRYSFEAWIEEHSDTSRDWTDLEREIAAETRKSMLDALASQTFELNHAKNAAEHAARTDFLTDLCNRRFFFESCELIAELAHRYQQPYSVIMLDLDEFKSINDRYGHCAGDDVLRTVAKIVRASSRSADIAGRLGGEEFALCLPNTGSHEAFVFAERLRRTIADLAIDTHSGPIKPTASLGVSTYRSSDATFENTLARADRALYAAKESGRNRVHQADVAR